MESKTILDRLSTAGKCVRLHRKKAWLISTGLLVGAVVISCVSVSRVIMAPPQIPGATFVGSQTCEQCHDNITKRFKTATHALLKAEGANAANVGCESAPWPAVFTTNPAPLTHHQSQKSPEICFNATSTSVAIQFAAPSPVLKGSGGCSDCHNPHSGPA
jgi:hypothetical protein